MSADVAQTRQKAAELAREAAALVEVWMASDDSDQRAEAAKLEEMRQRFEKIADGKEINDGTVGGVPLTEIATAIELAAVGADISWALEPTNDS